MAGRLAVGGPKQRADPAAHPTPPFMDTHPAGARHSEWHDRGQQADAAAAARRRTLHRRPPRGQPLDLRVAPYRGRPCARRRIDTEHGKDARLPRRKDFGPIGSSLVLARTTQEDQQSAATDSNDWATHAKKLRFEEQRTHISESKDADLPESRSAGRQRLYRLAGRPPGVCRVSGFGPMSPSSSAAKSFGRTSRKRFANIQSNFFRFCPPGPPPKGAT